MKSVAALSLILLLSIHVFAEVKVDVRLSPAGSFVAETKKVKGYAYKTKSGVAAENVEVDITSITTGMSLRDKHLKERLLTKKFPKAKLIKAVGKNGVGKASIQIKGIKRTYSGTYKIEGSSLQASFDVNLPDLKINDVKYMGVGVKDVVTVNITLPLRNKK